MIIKNGPLIIDNALSKFHNAFHASLLHLKGVCVKIVVVDRFS